jgi:hypothetical protein
VKGEGIKVGLSHKHRVHLSVKMWPYNDWLNKTCNFTCHF